MTSAGKLRIYMVALYLGYLKIHSAKLDDITHTQLLTLILTVEFF